MGGKERDRRRGLARASRAATLRVGCALSCVVVPLSAPAQTGTAGDAPTPPTPTTPAPPRTDQLAPVQITGTRPDDVQERRQSTVAKIVIGREEIDRFGDSTLGDVLKRLPGVTIQGRPGRGGAIRLRGLGNGYTQILLDGERVPPGFSLDSLSPDRSSASRSCARRPPRPARARSPAPSTSSPARATTGESTTCA